MDFVLPIIFTKLACDVLRLYDTQRPLLFWMRARLHEHNITNNRLYSIQPTEGIETTNNNNIIIISAT